MKDPAPNGPPAKPAHDVETPPSPSSATPPPRPRDLESESRLQQALDDALADSFPASDPVSLVTSQHEECWEAESAGHERKERET